MKTPEENKCGMECIRTNVKRICVKPEKGQCHRCEQLVSESLARIQQLESRLAQVEKERDAAIHDLHRYCSTCKHDPRKEFNKMPCKLCMDNKIDGYEWRGVCAENSKEESM